ncbi:MAG: glutathione S-transferase family protein [Burkholderiaceae bacterium]|nr:glutathione S-transferase family protein [Burkholderiaceae bacterium]
MKLVIGNKNYSSWSLRPWLALKMAGIEFDEVRIPLDQPDTKSKILRYSPTGKVPCLIDGRLTVWDSLAICEYVNETHAQGGLWPADRATRATARAITAEMHSGFAALRTHLSMDIRARKPARGAEAQRLAGVQADIERIVALWTAALDASGGPMLFGEFCIADAFYAPVVTRFVTYGVALPPLLAAYSDRVLSLPPMQAWVAAAQAEVEELTDH